MRMCGLKIRSEEGLPVMALAQHFRSARGDESRILNTRINPKDEAEIGLDRIK